MRAVETPVTNKMEVSNKKEPDGSPFLKRTLKVHPANMDLVIRKAEPNAKATHGDMGLHGVSFNDSSPRRFCISSGHLPGQAEDGKTSEKWNGSGGGESDRKVKRLATAQAHHGDSSHMHTPNMQLPN